MLRRIPADSIELGMELPGNVCDQFGTVLLPAGTTISDQHLASLKGRRFRGVFVGGDWPAEDLPDEPEQRVIKSTGGATLTLGKRKPDADDAPASATPPAAPALTETPIQPASPPPGKRAPGLEGELVPVDQLRVGSTIRQNLYDPHGKLLLAAGHEVSARFLFLLRQRGAHAVRMHAEDLAQATKASRPLRGMGDTRKRLTISDLRCETARGVERHSESAHELQDLCQTLARGRAIKTDKVKSVINDFADMVDLDQNLISMVVATQKTLGEYLFDHSINVAMLSVAALNDMGMDRQQIQQVALGAAFQDIGMLRVSQELRLANRKLDAREWSEVRRHPTFTCDQLENARGISPLAANISFQVHERTDGSGYPRGRLSASIHPGARVVAIADAYAAMVRPRPYRPAHLPHQAMQELLRECRRNRLDKVALKAFLNVMSLYPIGSYVSLNTGQICQVVRSNPGTPTQPVVAVLDGDCNASDTTIDLRYTREIGIEQAVHPAQLPRPDQ